MTVVAREKVGVSILVAGELPIPSGNLVGITYGFRVDGSSQLHFLDGGEVTPLVSAIPTSGFRLSSLREPVG